MNDSTATRSPQGWKPAVHERRRVPRQRCSWPVTMATNHGARRATAANIGSRGLLLHLRSDEAPEPGVPVRIVVHVPPAHQDRGAYFQYRAEGTGRVVRHEPGGAPELPVCGVAVAFDRPLELRETFVGLP